MPSLLESVTPVFRFSSWDFETILKTTAFIDRSLLLKTMFEEKEKALILAPRQSGKSTNLNMAKRFLEINVYENGSRKEKTKSPNYMLFVKKNLKVYRNDKHFFHNNFGTYPVIYIDYHPLSAINNFSSVIEKYREILLKSFQCHEYLKNNVNLWSNGNRNSRELFVMYCLSEGNFSLTESEIKQGIPFLSKVLYEHFGKKVYILMDEYDALFDSQFLRDSPEKNKIVSFIYEVNNIIFKSNQYIYRGLVCGVSRHNCSNVNILPNNIFKYSYENVNPFSQFYGVSADELLQLLSIFIKNPAKRDVVKNIITCKSLGVELQNNLYNTWFVLRQLANLNETYLKN